MKRPTRLGVGFVGSGFNTRFHIQGWQGVRDADVKGVWSPNGAHAASAAKLAQACGVGDAKAYKSIAAMVADPDIHAIWLSGPNQARVENVEEICDTIERGKGELIGIACEKPLARTVTEARHVAQLVKRAGLRHGYLENQLFAPGLSRGRDLIWARGASTTGRPFLARAAEEHSGPHNAWFWQGSQQGGGVLNDMMCHSIEVVRFLLTEPGKPRRSLKPVAIDGRIASLKWSRPEYVRELKERYGRGVDYARRPSEDFASVTVTFRTDSGDRGDRRGDHVVEFRRAGAPAQQRIARAGIFDELEHAQLGAELLLLAARQGESRAKTWSRSRTPRPGLMPVVPDEAATYGYVAEDRHFVRVFLGKEKPLLTWDDGVEVVRTLMAAYMSAEQKKTLAFPPRGVEEFVPAVARGTWRP